jgi:hypothetical protein
MKHIIIKWMGGEGGDIIFGLLGYCLAGFNEWNISKNGSAHNPDVDFSYKNYHFSKSHLLWSKEEKHLKNVTDKFVFLLKPIDIPCFVKKKISKLYLNPKILPDQEIPPKPLGRKFLKALHDNDQKLAYYYGFKTIKTIYDGYEEHAEHFLSQIPHQKIYTNLLTVDEVLSVLKQIEENIDLPINVNDQALNWIEYYVEKQQQYVADWPHLDH